MKMMMKKMGVTQDDIPGVEEVRITTKDTVFIFSDAEVVRMVTPQGESWQVSGNAQELPRDAADALPSAGSKVASGETSAAAGPAVDDDGIPKADVEMVMSQTGTDFETARAALKKANGNPAEAILNLIGG